MIDNEPLQRAAWDELRAARKRHDQAARDLHRHEQVDTPEYDRWLHRTFPVLISTLRDLHQEVYAKARQVQTVQAMASLTGRSAKKLWKEQKESENEPDSPDPEAAEDEEFSDERRESRRRRTFEDFFGTEDFGDAQNGDGFDDSPRGRSSSSVATQETKAIYRRLVQKLHPDRGGEFTPARQRLWHEVQQAWAARDADWLARIEAEWDSANEVLGPKTPVGRLQRAIKELHAARRDTEKKLHTYRTAPSWRFTRSKSKEALRKRIQTNFTHDLEFLRKQLSHLDSLIAAWESPNPRSRRRHESEW